MTLLAAYLGSLVPALGWTLAHFLWQGALVGLVLEVLLKTCRTAQARHNLALGALMLMAALPIITFCWLQGDVRVVFAPAGFPGLTESQAVTWEKVAVGAWLIGVAALAVRMAGGLWLVERWRRGATPLPPLWASRCALLQQRMAGSLKVVFAQSTVAAPLVAGWLKPMVLIPTAALTHMPVDQLEALILHELAHVRRFDAFANLIQAVVETALFYHPAVWWVSRRIRVEREHCCDDLAVAAVQDPALYVRALQSLEALRPAPAGALASNGGDLKVRAARILGLASAPERPALSRMAAVLILTLAGAAVTHSAAVKAEPAPPARLAKATAATSSPARVSGIPRESDEALANKAVVLARNDVVVGPNVTVAATGGAAAPLALTQTVAAPRLDPASSQAPPALQAAPPADASNAAASFIRSYAAATAGRGAIARWINAICVHVTGVAPDQAAAVKARVEQIAKEVGLGIQPTACTADIQIVFTADPQGTLRDVMQLNGDVLGDPTSGTADARTASLPIQAWYLTNGRDVAANEKSVQKTLADYHADGRAGLKTLVQWENTPIGRPLYGSRIPGGTGDARQFLNVLVIIDSKRTGGMSLRPVGDDVAMLALSQPKSLGQCQALPSITDLFDACPGRAAPESLTPADTAYLHALYSDHSNDRSPSVADVTKAMAPLLANTGPIASAAWKGPADISAGTTRSAGPARPAEKLAPVAADPTDLKGQTRSFAKAVAFSDRYTVGRWLRPICVKVAGLSPDQTQEVRTRVESLAGQFGIAAQGAGCTNANIQIGFTNDPQGMLEEVVALNGSFILGDRRAEKPTRPVQAWYRTNDQDGQPQANLSGASSAMSRGLLTVLLIVDIRRTGGLGLNLLADYVAMMALSEHRPVDRCNTLPSIGDLFVGQCPGRAAPDGLTSADQLYLSALYQWNDRGVIEPSNTAAVAGRMAAILGDGRFVAHRAPPTPALLQPPHASATQANVFAP